MGNGILESIGINTDVVVILLFIFVMIQFILVFFMFSKYNQLNRRMSRFTSGRDGRSLEGVIGKRFSEIRQIVKNEKNQNKNIDLINDKFATTFCKIGLVKYDAFKEMSGKLSFSLALLTENHDGIIITSIHSREGCYTYCKEISNAESYYVLSEEERIALDVAIGKAGAKEEAKTRENKVPDIGY